MENLPVRVRFPLPPRSRRQRLHGHASRSDDVNSAGCRGGPRSTKFSLAFLNPTVERLRLPGGIHKAGKKPCVFQIGSRMTAIKPCKFMENSGFSESFCSPFKAV